MFEPSSGWKSMGNSQLVNTASICWSVSESVVHLPKPRKLRVGPIGMRGDIFDEQNRCWESRCLRRNQDGAEAEEPCCPRREGP